jgi:hypothetical protein
MRRNDTVLSVAPMTSASSGTGERWAAAAGFAMVVVVVVGDALMGTSPPDVSEPASTIAAYFRDHHDGLLVGSALTGVGAALFTVLFTGLAHRIHRYGESLLAAAALVVVVSANVLATAPDALLQSTAHLEDDESAKDALITSGLFLSKAFWFGSLAAALVAAAAWRGALPRWYAVVASVAVPLLALGGTAVGAGGTFRIAGPVTDLAFLGFVVWVVSTAAVLWRRAS